MLFSTTVTRSAGVPGLSCIGYEGDPSKTDATIKLENGKAFIVEAQNQSEENVYVQSVTLNGTLLKRPFLKHDDVVKGGKLVFVMGAKPNTTVFQ